MNFIARWVLRNVQSRVESCEKRLHHLEVTTKSLEERNTALEELKKEVRNLDDRADKTEFLLNESQINFKKNTDILDHRLTSLSQFLASLEISVNERFCGFFNILERQLKSLFGHEAKTDLVNSLLRKLAKLEDTEKTDE